MSSKVTLDPTWHSRRQVIRLTLLSCFGLAVYSMYLGVAMVTVVFPNVAMLAGAVIGSYVFGASYERTNGVPSLTTYQSTSQTTDTNPLEPPQSQ